MNRNRKKAAAASLAAGMAVVLGAGTVMAAASTSDNKCPERRDCLCKYNSSRRCNRCYSI